MLNTFQEEISNLKQDCTIRVLGDGFQITDKVINFFNDDVLRGLLNNKCYKEGNYIYFIV